MRLRPQSRQQTADRPAESVSGSLTFLVAGVEEVPGSIPG